MESAVRTSDTARAHRWASLSCALAVAVTATGCGGAPAARPLARRAPAAETPSRPAASPALGARLTVPVAPVGQPTGVPAPRATDNVYRTTLSQKLDPAVAGTPERVYVPDALAAAVDVIDPASFRVVARLAVGQQPGEVRSDWDLRKLWVSVDGSNKLAEINPRLGRVVRTVPVADPSHLYFTPDGRRAIVVAGHGGRVDVRDRRSWRLKRSVSVPGVEDLDVSADGRSALLGIQGGRVVGLDLSSGRLTETLAIGGAPGDVRLGPSGRAFFVTDQSRGGVSIVSAGAPRNLGFIRTASGASGMALSRSTRSLFVANRSAGTISVIDVARRRLRRSWLIGGSPEELQVSPNGRQLWVSGRYDGAVYVLDTTTGRVLHVIRVGARPEGLSFFPEPGRHSVGHDYR